MKPKLVLVELNESGDAIRIFRNAKAARASDGYVEEWTKELATRNIRRQVYERSKDEFGTAHCEYCGAYIIWEKGKENSGHMHEAHAKGKRDENGNYGEVSVENSVFICKACHTGPNGAHGDRYWQSSKIREQ